MTFYHLSPFDGSTNVVLRVDGRNLQNLIIESRALLQSFLFNISLPFVTDPTYNASNSVVPVMMLVGTERMYKQTQNRIAFLAIQWIEMTIVLSMQLGLKRHINTSLIPPSSIHITMQCSASVNTQEINHFSAGKTCWKYKLLNCFYQLSLCISLRLELQSHAYSKKHLQAFAKNREVVFSTIS